MSILKNMMCTYSKVRRGTNGLLSLILISSFRNSMQYDNVCKMKMQSMSQATSRLAGRIDIRSKGIRWLSKKGWPYSLDSLAIQVART